jgi:hypothetical protein
MISIITQRIIARTATRIITRRSLSSTPKDDNINTRVISVNNQIPKLIFIVNDHKSLINIIKAIEKKNYTIITPNGIGSTTRVPNNIFLL